MSHSLNIRVEDVTGRIIFGRNVPFPGIGRVRTHLYPRLIPFLLKSVTQISKITDAVFDVCNSRAFGENERKSGQRSATVTLRGNFLAL